MKTSSRLSALVAVMLLASGSMMAQQISLDEAMATARTILSASPNGKAKAMAKSQLSLAYQSVENGNTHYYVFNAPSQDGGFVIVGGDMAAQKILGFSEKGTFQYDQLPPNMKWWLSQYDEQIGNTIRLVKEGKIELTDEAAVPAKNMRKAGAKTNVPNFVTTEWNQNEPYNSLLPSLGPGYTGNSALATGCVATAGAQVMKYYNYPSTGTGSNSYDISWAAPVGTKTFEANFGGTNYAWSAMQDNYATSYSGTTAEKAVATLMYHVGVACNMDYGQIGGAGSGSNDSKLGIGMIKYFKYDAGMRNSQRHGYTDAEWEDMLYAEMVARRPVVYSGATVSNEGHTFVISGFSKDAPYSDGQGGFYVNWGWGGNHNGYFPITGTVGGIKALTPDGTGIGGGAAGSTYSYRQSMLYGIRPDAGNRTAIKMYCTEYYAPSTNVYVGSKASIERIDGPNTGFYSETLVDGMQITVGVKLVSTSTEEATYIEDVGRNKTFTESEGIGNINFNVPASLVGTYKVYPAYKDENGDWQVMEYPVATQEVPVITVSEPASLFLTERADFGNGGYTIYDGTDAESANITLKLKNNSGAPIDNHEILIWIYPAGTGTLSSITYFEQKVSLAVGESKTVTYNKGDIFKKTAVSVGNKYQFLVEDYTTDFKLQSLTPFYLTTKATINYELTSAGWGTICLPFDAEIPSGMKVYSALSHTGSALDLTEETEIKMNTPYIVSGTPATYQFVGPNTPADDYTRGLLTGTTKSGASIPAESYILQDQSGNGLGFYKTGGIRTAQQYRAYLSKTAGSASIEAFFLPDENGDDPSAISNVGNETVAPVSIHTLGGAQVNTLQKGINIVRMSDGSVKKVLVK
ncbi:MAG: C10 family peptidase [Prevotellaceae bacterium]|nr:C10 family peptidase [Candidatus Minthosoma equi]